MSGIKFVVKPLYTSRKGSFIGLVHTRSKWARITGDVK